MINRVEKINKNTMRVVFEAELGEKEKANQIIKQKLKNIEEKRKTGKLTLEDINEKLDLMISILSK